jgi:hypothetical protein
MASWNHDGTQDPGPPPLMSDPLSGLVTGGKYDAEAVRVRVVEPAAPDIDAVREAMASVLDEDSELMIRMPPSVAEPAPVPVEESMGANDPDAGDGGEGVGPAAESAPPAPAPPPPTPPAGIPMAKIPLQRGTPPRPPRSRSFSPGIAAVGVLLVVIAVLVIVMLASLIDTISSLFS